MGRALAVLKASAAPEAVAPRATASSALRTNPRIRLVRVPANMTALDRASEFWGVRLTLPPHVAGWGAAADRGP